MGARVKKRKLLNGASMRSENEDSEDTTFAVSAVQATDAEKLSWQGFCEIESEPAFFNVMLKEFGVEGVKVQEVLGLDDELLAILPKPVYGLIFLFRFIEDDSLQQEASCPEHIWFANQTSDFSCATVAMLNIVNNVQGLSLGEHLQQFKNFTMDFTPALRGDQIGNFEFVKQIHNSFARHVAMLNSNYTNIVPNLSKMDMMNIDLGLKNAFNDRKKRKSTTNYTSTTSKKTKENKSKKSKVITDQDYEEDSAFHFIAYVPINDEVWKLDGLDRQPAKLGRMADGEDWLNLVSKALKKTMANYEEGQLEFGLLSLVKDPIIDLQEQLAENIKALQMTETQLGVIKSDWRAFVEDETPTNENSSPDNTIIELESTYPVSDAMIQDANVAKSYLTQIQSHSSTALVQLRQNLILAQIGLKAAVREEEASNKADEERALDRRHDYGPLIHTWLGMLADRGVLRELVDQSR